MKSSRTLKAGILSLGKLLTSVVGILSAMVLSRLFSKSDYATYRQSLMVYSFAAPLLMLGLPNAIYFFMPNRPDLKRNIIASNIFLLALTGSFFTVFLLFGGSAFLASQFNNAKLARTLPVIAFYPLFVLPVTGLSACLTVNDRIKTLASFNVVSRLLMFLCALLPVFIFKTPFSGVVGYVIGGVVVMVPALYLFHISVDTGQYRINLHGMMEQLKFAVPLGLASMVGVLSLNLDKVLISKFYTPDIFAVYINGAMELPLVGVVTGSVTAIILADITKMIAASSFTDALNLWKRAAVKCSVIILPLFGIFMLLAPEIMVLLYGEQYVDSAIPFRIYLLLLPIRVVSFGVVLMGAGKSHLVLINSVVGLLLNLVLSLLLIKWIGYLGVVVATVIVVYVWSVIFNIYFIRRILRCSYRDVFPFIETGRILAIVLLSFFISTMALFFLQGTTIIIRCVVCSILYVSILCLFFHLFGVVSLIKVISFIKSLVKGRLR